MKWIVLFCLTCFLIAGVYSCGPSAKQKQDMYYYYMQLATNYEAAAVNEEVQAEHYLNIARGLQSSGMSVGQEDYETFLEIATTHTENARKYHQLAEQYRAKARQYQ